MASRYDAVIVGSGPNGLAAAILLARCELSTLVIERAEEPGGGARSDEITLPGFVHDICSTVHPLAFASPFLSRLSLERYGLLAVHSPAALAHVLAPGETVLLERSLETTLAQFGEDAAAYRELFAPLISNFDELATMILGPLRWPRHPLPLARFGLSALRSLLGLARSNFRRREVPALLAGMAAHAMLPLDQPATAAFGLVLGAAGHAVGWPITRGGSRSITAALVSQLRDLGGELELGREVTRIRDLPPARAYLFDVTPRQLLAMTESELPTRYRSRLERFRYGPGVFKMDWALRGPVPWLDPACARAATVHLSGDMDAVARATAAPHRGRVAEHPFVLFVQPSLFDPTRAPPGQHTAWAYCHVPNGSTQDLSTLLEAEIERYAPGFRDLVLARSTRNSREIEAYNPNYVGGDINGGSAEWTQLFTRPITSVDPYATSAPEMFLCSSSTPPGGGVHGMCGYFAAKSALRKIFDRAPPPELDIDHPSMV